VTTEEIHAELAEFAEKFGVNYARARAHMLDGDAEAYFKHLEIARAMPTKEAKTAERKCIIFALNLLARQR